MGNKIKRFKKTKTKNKSKKVKVVVTLFVIAIIAGLSYFVACYKQIPLNWAGKKVYAISEISMNFNMNYINDISKFTISRTEQKNDVVNDEESFFSKTKYSFNKSGKNSDMVIEYVVTYYNADDSVRQELITEYYIENGKYMIDNGLTTKSVSSTEWQTTVEKIIMNCVPLDEYGYFKGHQVFKDNLEKVAHQYFHFIGYASTEKVQYAYYYNPFSKKITNVYITTDVYHNDKKTEVVYDSYNFNFKV